MRPDVAREAPRAPKDVSGPPNGSAPVCRTQESTSRISIWLRTSEGRYGALQAYVWPRVPPKICRATTYQIRPLSLHTRLQSRPEQLPAMNTLKISGSFTLSEVHSWVVATLPEVRRAWRARACVAQLTASVPTR